ncbi:MAG TPA: multiheme c-type cytochrome, partial [Nitrospirota bacterium]|nr:multiheme c-type cytochrome [Nitrospirota bacterium]
MKHLRILFVFGFVLLFVTAASAAPKQSACVECHKKVTPGIVQQHLDGKMGKKGVDCSACHGSAHMKMDDAKLASMPTPETCARYHPKQTEQFKAGKHNLAWIASSSMPMMGHQPKAVAGEGYKGCSSCHKIGAKPEAEKSQIRYGHAQCD